MIVVAILALAYVVISKLVATFASFPTMPTSFLAVVQRYLPYVIRGVKFLNGFTHAEIVMPLVLVCIATHDAYTIYRLVMYVMKKIPMFGVSD